MKWITTTTAIKQYKSPDATVYRPQHNVEQNPGYNMVHIFPFKSQKNPIDLWGSVRILSHDKKFIKDPSLRDKVTTDILRKNVSSYAVMSDYVSVL